MDEAFGRRVARVGSLADPVRRALYRFVAEQPGAVSRDQAASGVDVPRHTAKFHLERLVEEGLLVTEFRRLTGRTGPGAGRPAKLYRRSRRELSVSVPSRRYDLAGQVLADAVERTLAGMPMPDALAAAADAAADAVAGGAAEPLLETLARLGYEPGAEDDGALCLANCPFDRLATDHRDLVCGVNRSFLTALARRFEAVAEPVAPGPGCCARVRPQLGDGAPKGRAATRP
ncbi:helix-turn-helix transcriptional regulator [Nocardioides daeguensis]|uniref:Transcriptional regulator n=1 Tax=Nocardioides daeguensis TaxID=908359 RepID=A0ABP6VRT2_9ACTN|nr:helix-turn-helix domain-containing protein [Nocardioides daeguensis]MBV6727580.1 helix-turn-helix domain-containing protein [Nocardioides daeguensis]MCR1773198.1 helix-turn-helix domain-containing protein [Nocardioides daeguensis]